MANMVEVVQGVLSLLGPIMGANFTSYDTSSNGTYNGVSSGQNAANVTSLGSLITFILSFAALRDWIKLFLIGGALEVCRRLLYWIYESGIEGFFMYATFKEDDDAYGKTPIPTDVHRNQISC